MYLFSIAPYPSATVPVTPSLPFLTTPSPPLTPLSRVNRGIRVQYSSALGPYEGPTTFSSRVNFSNCKANAFDTMFTNALSGKNLGGAYGGADFNPYNKRYAGGWVCLSASQC